MKAVRFPDKLKPILEPIDSIHQHPSNANNGDLDELIESIKRYGFVTAITVDSKTGEIVAGNHRYQALLALGATQAPVLWVDHWDRDDALGYLVGDNEIARRARMDKRQLLDILKYLDTTEKGLWGTGHDTATLQRLMQEVAADMVPMPTTPGFGGNVAPNGIFQVVVDFYDPDERDDLYAELVERYEDRARQVNL